MIKGKKIISALLIGTLCLGMSTQVRATEIDDTKQKAEELQKQKEAAEVISAISIIGPVTLESETAIVNARTLYNALTDEIKANVTNYQTLVDAETALAALKSGAAPAPAEQPVDGTAGN